MQARLSEQIVEFASSRPPDDVRKDARLRLMDALGLAIAGRRTPQAAAIVQTAAAAFGAGPCRTAADRVAVAPAAAAMINSVLIHVLDYDDTYLPGSIHTSPSIIPAALAAADYAHASVEQTLDALVIATEVACWLSIKIGHLLSNRGFHAGALIGGISAAVAAGLAMKLEPLALMNAIGLATNVVGGTSQFEECWAKNWNVCSAAQTGVMAAIAATNGFTGPVEPLQGNLGFLHTHLGGDADIDFGSIGKRWLSREIGLKRFGCCHFLQSVVACAIEASSKIEASDIRAVDVKVPDDFAMRCIARPEDIRRRPENVYRARFAGPWLVARALIDKSVSLQTFDTVRPIAQDIMSLADRIQFSIEEFPSFPKNWPARVTVERLDGERISVFDAGQPIAITAANETVIYDKLKANIEYGALTSDTFQKLHHHLITPRSKMTNVWDLIVPA